MNFEEMNVDSGRGIQEYLKKQGFEVKATSPDTGQNVIRIPCMVSFNWKKSTKQIRLNCKKEAMQVIEQKTNLKHIDNGEGDKTHEYSFLFDTFEQFENAVESLKIYNDSYEE